MLPGEFIKKHKINLSESDLKLCNDAMIMMRESLDVYHDETHVFRLLDCLDEFMSIEEYRKISQDVDVRSLFIAILWHDTWKAGRDPKNILQLVPDIIFEGLASARKFQKAANIAGLDDGTVKKVKYMVRKHSSFQILSAVTTEGKIMLDIDRLDVFSLDRLYLIEKKYSCDRLFTHTTLHLAKFSIKYAVPGSVNSYSFDWTRKEFLKKKDAFLKRAQRGIDDYEEALGLLENGDVLGFENYRKEWVAQHMTRTEELESSNPF